MMVLANWVLRLLSEDSKIGIAPKRTTKQVAKEMMEKVKGLIQALSFCTPKASS